MKSTVMGEVRVLAESQNPKYRDLAILPEGAANSVRIWSFADADGLGAVQVGDLVEADCYTQAKAAKETGRPYLSTQLKAIRVAQVKGEKLHKVS